MHEIIIDGIRKLPKHERDVAEMCWKNGLSSVQAASLLGIAAGTVRSRLSVARGRLRRMLHPGDFANTALPAVMNETCGASATDGKDAR